MCVYERERERERESECRYNNIELAKRKPAFAIEWPLQYKNVDQTYFNDTYVWQWLNRFLTLFYDLQFKLIIVRYLQDLRCLVVSLYPSL
jgi:hypothetical protein